MKKLLALFLVPATTMIFIFSCNGNKPEHNSEELAQQIGDVMASVDEFGGTTGTLASLQAYQNTFDRFSQGAVQGELQEFKNGALIKSFQPAALITTCLNNGFGLCFSGVMTRNFAGCTVLAATFNGTVKLTWNNLLTCSMSGPTEYITRVPNFTVTGRLGATLAVTKIGAEGQRLTWVSGTGLDKIFAFESDGINRTFATPDKIILFDQTTLTISPITVAGTSRSNRIMTGGSLRVRNNINLDYCDYTPSNVAWTANCNCPTSGTWSGVCSNSNTSTLVITGCGTATFADGSLRENVIFDRCGI